MSDARTAFVTFSLAGEEFAVSLEHVREIVACGPITRVPSVPPFLLGVLNLRGAALPIVDLAKKFGFAATAVTRWTCVVVVRVTIAGEPVLLGVLVDAMNRLIECAAPDIEAVPPLGTCVRPEYLLGLIRDDDRFFLLLDVERVLSEHELLVVASIDPTAPARP